MVVNIEIEKSGNENNLSVIKRFSRKVQTSGILRKAKSLRYNKRPSSDLTKKNKALKSVKRKKEIDRLIKLGKISDNRMRNK